ncbi:regulatory LuxR family protein [Panacagrimonas perspica]|uniref:Regulatory LuxR family protein n=1 Tax=Panacagrimonas perspica TaxID=381431 RepID=A0A4R7P574_9GAMM|nr:response regulator transcription factor [Panacagrimonas perspica]TDU28964.1 regulatory LuxR family protein [Panacagrimonas perspica]THD02218.1 hypothetical protein B1810_14890 [Panacagrimonas perspica]
MDRVSSRSDALDKDGIVSGAREGGSGLHRSGSIGEKLEPMRASVVPYAKLTRREQQVIQMLSRGWSNKRIASELFVAQDTVKFHLKASYRKIGVHSRMEAVYVASQLGLVRFPAATPSSCSIE